MTTDSTDDRLLLRLERQVRFLLGAFLLTLILLISSFASRGTAEPAAAQGQTVSEDAVLRVRGLVIVDENGIERVRIEAPFIAPLCFGKRYRRQGDMGGILMFDGDGNERSGYATANDLGPVLFTLDTLAGDAAHFTAQAEGGVDLWLREGANTVRLGASEAGPELAVIKAGENVFRQPAAEGQK